jgi:hypothetical protein
MYMSATLARDRHLERLERARQARIARQAAKLRRVERIVERVERRMLRDWRRADELRTMMEAVG